MEGKNIAWLELENIKLKERVATLEDEILDLRAGSEYIRIQFLLNSSSNFVGFDSFDPTN